MLFSSKGFSDATGRVRIASQLFRVSHKKIPPFSSRQMDRHLFTTLKACSMLVFDKMYVFQMEG